jgi:hypothetical protein
MHLLKIRKNQIDNNLENANLNIIVFNKEHFLYLVSAHLW